MDGTDEKKEILIAMQNKKKLQSPEGLTTDESLEYWYLYQRWLRGFTPYEAAGIAYRIHDGKMTFHELCDRVYGIIVRRERQRKGIPSISPLFPQLKLREFAVKETQKSISRCKDEMEIYRLESQIKTLKDDVETLGFKILDNETKRTLQVLREEIERTKKLAEERRQQIIVHADKIVTGNQISVKNSVIYRSKIGSTEQEAIYVCQYCGEELNFPKPKFCPYCKEQLK